MKLKELYRKPGVVVGLVLVLLGAGNWIVGSVQVKHYRAVTAARSKTQGDDYRGLGERTRRGSREVLGRIHDERESHDAARMKMDFFYVVLTGGLVLFVSGLAAACFALFGRSVATRPAGPPH